MDNLFQTHKPYEKYNYILSYPLESERKALLEPNRYYHTQNCYAICNDKIKHIDKGVIIKNKIECLFFLYVDFGEKTWDDKYWFFIGKLKEEVYFMYESDCCGTGFGLGSKSTLYFAKKPELLTTYGLTDKHRDLITKNIEEMRFTCPNEDHLWLTFI